MTRFQALNTEEKVKKGFRRIKMELMHHSFSGFSMNISAKWKSYVNEMLISDDNCLSVSLNLECVTLIF